MIKQFIPQDVCLKCQGCCRFQDPGSVWSPCLLDEEIQEFLDKSFAFVSISADRRIQPIPNPDQEGFVCPFLNIKDNKCQVYDFRPFECQLYPFLISIRDKKVLLTLDPNCPYARQKLNSKEFKDYTDRLTAFLNSAKQKRTLKDNPQIIQAYEQVMDVIELKI